MAPGVCAPRGLFCLDFVDDSSILMLMLRASLAAEMGFEIGAADEYSASVFVLREPP
jgi:hypothetical protein